MESRVRLSVLFACSALLLAACGGGDSGDSGSAPPTASPAPSPAPATAAASATLQWSAPNDARIQGFRIYYGTGSRNYQQAKGSGLNAAGATAYVVGNLPVGVTYYFAVTAYDTAGNESDYSSEAVKVIR